MVYIRGSWHSYAITAPNGNSFCLAAGERETQQLLKLLNPAEAEADEFAGLPVEIVAEASLNTSTAYEVVGDFVRRAAAKYTPESRLAAKCDALRAALAMLLIDVEGSVDYGMPFTDPEHGFHKSVMAARKALNK